MSNLSSSSKPDRKLIERNRRNEMKTLYARLNSLLPRPNFRESTSLSYQLDQAEKYIKKLQMDLEKMKEKKNRLLEIGSNSGSNNSNNNNKLDNNNNNNNNIKLPKVKVNEIMGSLEVILITGLDNQFIFNETIRVLHEEGFEIVNASFSIVDDHTIFHTIHSKVEECRHGCGADVRVSQRLEKFVLDHGGAF